VEVLARRVLPYFKRTELKFSSHFQTPPRAEADSHPAIIAGKNFVYFADPIFREYRQFGNIAVRDAWKAAMLRLVGPAQFGASLPMAIQCTPRRRGKDLLLTVLHYAPVRKALSIDMIEEPGTFAGEELSVPEKVTKVMVFPHLTPLERLPSGNFALPAVKGRLLLVIGDYFA